MKNQWLIKGFVAFGVMCCVAAVVLAVNTSRRDGNSVEATGDPNSQARPLLGITASDDRDSLQVAVGDDPVESDAVQGQSMDHATDDADEAMETDGEAADHTADHTADHAAMGHTATGQTARGSVDDAGPIPEGAFEALRNTRSDFHRYATTPSNQLSIEALTVPAIRNDNGASGLGEFRVACEYSHFGYNDPIVYPGQPGASHLHMFFGNTDVDAFTTKDELVNSGGSTCNGFELNRSGYWTPALLDGKGSIVVPDQIIVYYKTHNMAEVKPMPQGLQIIAGNTGPTVFETSDKLNWSCGSSGHAYNQTNQIPDCGGDVINATIKFPDCWNGTDLQATDFKSHLTYGEDGKPCPSSHPVRLPQITILLYYPGVPSVDGWYISSDRGHHYSGVPGGSLHADWWGGWNDETMNLWVDNCLHRSRNCSYGQTATARQLAPLNPLQTFEGENFLRIPS